MRNRSGASLWLIGGDFIVALLIAVGGYLTHYAGVEPFSLRWLSTFLPFLLGWALAAGAAGLFQIDVAGDWRAASWRAAVAGLLAAPFAAMLRGLYLNAAISPTFAIVLALTSGLAMAVWRAVWAVLARRKNSNG